MIQKRAGAILFILCMLFVCACGTKGSKVVTGKGYYSSAESVRDTQAEETTEAEESKEDAELYLLMGYDTSLGLLHFEHLTSGKTEELPFTDGTFFLDKYGNLTSLASIEAGDVVTIEVSNESGALKSMQISDQAWYYENVTDYKIDTDRGVVSFGGTNYSYREGLPVFSAGIQEQLSQVGSGNSIRIVGKDKEILSMTVTTGQGSITLQNTELFEGGWLNLDNRIYLKITKDMTIDVEEGNHTLTVTGDGYGDTKEIQVKRNETLLVDLDTLKGEGPKYCSLSFEFGVEGTTVFLDGEEVDTTTPVQVKYGTHVLQARATGYDTWTRKLVVNSAKAILVIDVSQETVATTEASTEKSTETSTTKTSTETDSEKQSSSTSTSNTASQTSDATSAYLDTLSGIMDTLTNTGSDN